MVIMKCMNWDALLSRMKRIEFIWAISPDVPVLSEKPRNITGNQTAVISVRTNAIPDSRQPLIDLYKWKLFALRQKRSTS